MHMCCRDQHAACSVTSPLSWCTCASDSASALSQYQQAVFHHRVTEAHEIREESTKNNHTEQWDNPEPEHQRETGGRCFICHPTGIHPEGKQRDEMRCYCPTLLAQEKPDLMGVSDLDARWTTEPPAWKLAALLEQTVAPFVYIHRNFFLSFVPFGSRQVCIKVGPSVLLSMMSIDMELWIDFKLQGIFTKLTKVVQKQGEDKAGLIWTEHHYVPFSTQVTDVVSYTVSALHIILQSSQRLQFKAVIQCQNMCGTAVWDI